MPQDKAQSTVNGSSLNKGCTNSQWLPATPIGALVIPRECGVAGDGLLRF